MLRAEYAEDCIEQLKTPTKQTGRFRQLVSGAEHPINAKHD